MALDAMAHKFQAQHGNCTYNVFLSFRGKDTQKNFTVHLYYALKDADINVFQDDLELQRSEDISPELERAIEALKTGVTAFSERYAESGLCLFGWVGKDHGVEDFETIDFANIL